MERDEEIIKASTATFKENGDEFAKVVQLFWVSAFIAGAKWADEHPKDVWHSADEEPEGRDWRILLEGKNGKDLRILLEGKNGNHWVTSRYFMSLYFDNWQKFAEDEALTRWAYINDLLPKGGDV